MVESAPQTSRRPGLEEWLRFIRTDGELLIGCPTLLFQQAANQPDSTAPALAAQRRQQLSLERRPWIRWLNKPPHVSPCLLTFEDSGYTHGCIFSPDGTRVLAATSDDAVKLWDAMSGAELSTLRGHSDWVEACAFSPDGTRIVSASADNTLKIWDGLAFTELFTLTGHADRVSACAFSPDGTLIISGSWDRTLKLWDARSGAEVGTLPGHSALVNVCAFSPDGSRIVSAAETVKLWDASSAPNWPRSAGMPSG